MNATMPQAPTFTDAQIAEFLAVAKQTLVETPLCWLATRALDGGTNARAVNSTAGPPGSDEWARCIVVRRSSRKVAEIREESRVTLAYQHPSGDRFVALGGRATIIEDVHEMRARWSHDLDRQFPPGFAEANLIVLQVDVERIEVHFRGLTPEPFGAGRTLLERRPNDSWEFIPAW